MTNMIIWTKTESKLRIYEVIWDCLLVISRELLVLYFKVCAAHVPLPLRDLSCWSNKQGDLLNFKSTGWRGNNTIQSQQAPGIVTSESLHAGGTLEQFHSDTLQLSLPPTSSAEHSPCEFMWRLFLSPLDCCLLWNSAGIHRQTEGTKREDWRRKTTHSPWLVFSQTARKRIKMDSAVTTCVEVGGREVWST